MNKEDFARYVDAAMQADGLGFLRPVVEKELLHYEVFSAIDREGLLKSLVFQGGTSLRLCYGSERFSEDLDFAGGKDFSAQSMGAIKDCIIDTIGKRFALDISVREPRTLYLDTGASSESHVRVEKWMIAIQTSPERPDIPKQKIKMEIANIPAYTRDILPLRINYSVLEGRSQPLVAVESQDEILADKLIALPASMHRSAGENMEFTPTRIRHRDIWDIAWLIGRGAQMDVGLVEQKLLDYGMSNYRNLLEKAVTAISEITRGTAFREQMKRFLPQAQYHRVFARPGYEKYFETAVSGTFKQLQKEMGTYGKDMPSRKRTRKDPGMGL